MSQLQFNRPVAFAIAGVFAVLILVGFWYKLNPPFDKNAYYRDAAKATSTEGEVPAVPDASGNPPPPVASDQAYQPESGSN